MILLKTRDFIKVIAIFPGIFAPPLPNENQELIKFNANKEFWSNHVFLC
jgi:hypothetical protein